MLNQLAMTRRNIADAHFPAQREFSYFISLISYHHFNTCRHPSL